MKLKALLILLGLAFSQLGCSPEESQAASSALQTAAVSVTTAVASTREVSDSLTAVGEIFSRQAPALASEVTGQVIEVHSDVGQAVRAGQLLMRIDPAAAELELASATADIDQLRANLTLEARRARRLREMHARHAISEDQLEEAETRLKAMQANLQATQARLAMAQRQLAKTRITAPIDGVVQNRRVSLGDFVAVGTTVFELADVTHLRAKLSFPETVAAQIQPGQPVEIVSAVAPGVPVQTHITAVQPAVSRGNRMITAIIDFTNPGPMRPGSSASGTILARNRPNAVTVPPLAVVIRPEGDVVYTLDDGIARQRKVRTGQVTREWVEIIEGLAVGETVVNEGAAYLTDGAAVRVHEPLS